LVDHRVVQSLKKDPLITHNPFSGSSRECLACLYCVVARFTASNLDSKLPPELTQFSLYFSLLPACRQYKLRAEHTEGQQGREQY